MLRSTRSWMHFACNIGIGEISTSECEMKPGIVAVEYKIEFQACVL